MNTSRLAKTALAGALLLSPGFAQVPSNPMQGQPSQQQSNQQQQHPGVNQSSMADMQDSAPNSGVSGQMMKDKMFLRKAAEGGMAEVKLGQLASEKGSSQEVKEFGAKMVSDHTDLNNEMRPIAESMGVMLPKKLSQKDQDEYEKLNGLSGNDFDTEYLTYMVKDHHDDVREFRMEAAGATDPVLKTAVEKGARIIRDHSHMVDDIARSKGIAVPTRGPRPSPPPQ